MWRLEIAQIGVAHDGLPGPGPGHMLIRDFVAKVPPANLAQAAGTAIGDPRPCAGPVAEWQRRPSVGRTIGERIFEEERAGGCWVGLGAFGRRKTVTTIAVQKKKLHLARRRPSFDSLSLPFYFRLPCLLRNPPRPPRKSCQRRRHSFVPPLVTFTGVLIPAALLFSPRIATDRESNSQTLSPISFPDFFPNVNLTAGNSHHGRRAPAWFSATSI